MSTLIVVNNPKHWSLNIHDVKVISARSYLTDPHYYQLKKAQVFNLCRSYRYQSIGYYVSLLAAARGHKPLPSIATIQDMKTLAIVRLVSDELEDLIQHSLKPIASERFTLSIYFGRNLAKRYDRLSAHLYKLFQSPFLRAEFWKVDDEWQLHTIRPIAAVDIPQEHLPFIMQVAEEYFSTKRFHRSHRPHPRYDMAILVNPEEAQPPSNEKALRRFTRAAKKLDLSVELVEKSDYGRISEFDALFIRETTQVNHHTYRFARRAAAEGLVVVDDPASIERCSNKVFLTELLSLHNVPIPKTIIVHRDNKDEIAHKIGFPCIIKKPDSYFSLGVFKATNEEELKEYLERLLDESELIIAQEFMPTDFDWRVGILDRAPLYVCKYHMANNHWQIVKNNQKGGTDYGDVETFAVENAPPQVVKTALRAANLIGDGLYGVDLKQVGNSVYVIEINDNPNIDAGYEDRVLQDELYMKIMSVFLRRIEKRKGQKPVNELTLV